ncbi:MAG: DUF1345 domain-containing protein [Chitinophagaceae bacterium]|nr:DUF1345 domain-containing protein [Chitinophagaceae bacterium]
MNNKDRGFAVTDIFQRIHPITRLIIGIVLAAVVFFILRKEGRNNLVVCMCAWCVFSFTYLLISWIIIFSRGIEDIRKISRVNDGSQLIVALLILASSFASLIIVMLLVVYPDPHGQKMIVVPLSILAIILSWIMVHTVLLFHYAHEYYDDDAGGVNPEEGGLLFPGDIKPDYLDFAYYSFVIGMTFQVSDIQITSKKLRKLALLHGLIAFGLNTFVVALTINLIAGLRK